MRTNAVAEPSSVMSEDLVADVAHLVDANSEALEEELERLQDEFYESVEFRYDRRTERTYRDQWIPAGLLLGRAPTVQALGELIAGIEPRWRLDAILALEDLTLGYDDA